jgi:hypothetical protein
MMLCIWIYTEDGDIVFFQNVGTHNQKTFKSGLYLTAEKSIWDNMN